MRYFTVGMAGHIDHGKTTLTKALTNIDTDRLKEEKERKISIELGYAPLPLTNEISSSIIDVPGHERFIRQMIAGVAGIDLVIVVVAADEGVMPQTKEHLHILRFLGIEDAIIAVTKVDKVEDELLELAIEDIKESIQNTPFKNAPLITVDSVTHKGIDELKTCMIRQLEEKEVRDKSGAFRMPIDQAFVLRGQGVIVRGTVYEGQLKKGDTVKILPSDNKVRARQIQVHRKESNEVYAGQRAALNITGIDIQNVGRGDVLVSAEHYTVTSVIDTSIRLTDELSTTVKQRYPIKCHIGTTEVMGKIIFFDRNDVKKDENEILCQIRLDEPIVTKRGDRFILRRPSPVETIGGGWVIDPNGKRYRFGDETIKMLQSKKEGSPIDRIKDVLKENQSLSLKAIIQFSSLSEAIVNETVESLLQSNDVLRMKTNEYVLKETYELYWEKIEKFLSEYHDNYPLRIGVNKNELLQQTVGQRLFALGEKIITDQLSDRKLIKDEQYIALDHFLPTYPSNWKKRMENIVENVQNDGLQVKKWSEYCKDEQLPDIQSQELKLYLIHKKELIKLTDELYVHSHCFHTFINDLQRHTDEEFSLKEVKEVLDVSRKFLIPLLELLDDSGYTIRVENKRKWIKD